MAASEAPNPSRPRPDQGRRGNETRLAQKDRFCERTLEVIRNARLLLHVLWGGFAASGSSLAPLAYCGWSLQTGARADLDLHPASRARMGRPRAAALVVEPAFPSGRVRRAGPRGASRWCDRRRADGRLLGLRRRSSRAAYLPGSPPDASLRSLPLDRGRSSTPPRLGRDAHGRWSRRSDPGCRTGCPYFALRLAPPRPSPTGRHPRLARDPIGDRCHRASPASIRALDSNRSSQAVDPAGRARVGRPVIPS